jgi:AraC-like DNA-binding protein
LERKNEECKMKNHTLTGELRTTEGARWVKPLFEHAGKLPALQRAVALSRTTFSSRFAQVVGNQGKHPSQSNPVQVSRTTFYVVMG